MKLWWTVATIIGGRVGAGERRVKDSDRDGWLEYQQHKTVNGDEEVEDEIEGVDE